jgi:hypothetical protein
MRQHRDRSSNINDRRRAQATGRAFVMSLLTPEEKKLKGSEKEAVICGRLAIYYAREGNAGKARTFARLAIQSARVATRLAELKRTIQKA